MLDNVGLSLSLLKISIQHRATLLAEQCWTVLAWFELQAISLHVCLLSLAFLERYHSVKETPSLRLLHSNLTKGRHKSIGDTVKFLASATCWSHVGKSPQSFFIVKVYIEPSSSSLSSLSSSLCTSSASNSSPTLYFFRSSSIGNSPERKNGLNLRAMRYKLQLVANAL